MATEKESKINPDIIRSMFTYDKSGLLRWKCVPRKIGYKKTMEAGKPAFTTKERKGYMCGVLLGLHMKAHRVIWAWHNGKWPDDQIDHINGIPWDNRIENLRQVTNRTNCRNQSKPKSNTSGWIGVSFNKRVGKWSAKFRKNYIDYHVGYFNCPTAAGISVLIARRKQGFSENHGRDKFD